jgi:PAS domain S-box-containing protein
MFEPTSQKQATVRGLSSVKLSESVLGGVVAWVDRLPVVEDRRPPFPTKALAESMIANRLEAFPDAVIAVDGSGRIVQVNQLTEHLFGFDRGLLIGQKVETLIPVPCHPQHRRHRDDFVQTPKVRLMSAGFGKRRDGSEFPIEISLSPLFVENGSLIVMRLRFVLQFEEIVHTTDRLCDEYGMLSTAHRVNG